MIRYDKKYENQKRLIKHILTDSSIPVLIFLARGT